MVVMDDRHRLAYAISLVPARYAPGLADTSSQTGWCHIPFSSASTVQGSAAGIRSGMRTRFQAESIRLVRTLAIARGQSVSNPIARSRPWYAID